MKIFFCLRMLALAAEIISLLFKGRSQHNSQPATMKLPKPKGVVQ